ncbi:MAG: sigma-70 family RNA polymerase sigma factor [Thermoguttaceae bacterium]|jgi:RNA polymerase sigma-70 factor (ECF subfamily)
MVVREIPASGHTLFMAYNRNTTDMPGPAASGSTSSSLLERVKMRDEDAWRRLVDLYSPLLYEWCRHCGLQPEDAADVGQEVFGAVAAGVEGFRRDRPGDSFRGWLWTITKNKVRDHFRRRKGQAIPQGGTGAQQQLAQVPDQVPESTSSGAMPNHRLELRAAEVVRAGVEPRTWRAFWLVAVEGQSPAIVAESLGMSVEAVYVAKFRVRRKIREELDGLID